MKPRYYYRVFWYEARPDGRFPFSDCYSTRLGAKIKAWSLRRTPVVQNVRIVKMNFVNHQ